MESLQSRAKNTEAFSWHQIVACVNRHLIAFFVLQNWLLIQTKICFLTQNTSQNRHLTYFMRSISFKIFLEIKLQNNSYQIQELNKQRKWLKPILTDNSFAPSKTKRQFSRPIYRRSRVSSSNMRWGYSKTSSSWEIRIQKK